MLALCATFLLTMKLTIDGNGIKTLDDFYDQIEPYLVTGECPWGRNLDSLDEIVSTNFNYTDNVDLNIKEIIWTESNKSQMNLGRQKFDVLTEILSSNDDIQLRLE
jgi:RNAse (barnase) inhibitor barstar